MSNKNAKNFLKDSNYEDFIQTEIGLKMNTAKINAENTTFIVTPNKQSRAYYDSLDSKKTNRIGQSIETISVKSIPGSFYNKSSFENFIKSDMLFEDSNEIFLTILSCVQSHHFSSSNSLICTSSKR